MELLVTKRPQTNECRPASPRRGSHENHDRGTPEVRALDALARGQLARQAGRNRIGNLADKSRMARRLISDLVVTGPQELDAAEPVAERIGRSTPLAPNRRPICRLNARV